MRRLTTKPRSRLDAHGRVLFRSFADDDIDLKNNWTRRFRNALLCLTSSDPRWMSWVEREIDTEQMTLIEITRLIEARARILVLKPHRYFGRNIIGDMIFRDDWVFTDRGNLGPG